MKIKLDGLEWNDGMELCLPDKPQKLNYVTSLSEGY